MLRLLVAADTLSARAFAILRPFAESPSIQPAAGVPANGGERSFEIAVAPCSGNRPVASQEIEGCTGTRTGDGA